VDQTGVGNAHAIGTNSNSSPILAVQLYMLEINMATMRVIGTPEIGNLG